jgi:SAM-dependent methyltransferase
MENIYINGQYLKRHPTWDVQDSLWKANHIFKIIEDNKIVCRKVADIGCGAGGVLVELSKLMHDDIKFYGYDISPQAIGLAKEHMNARISFQHEDFLSVGNTEYFDLLLIIDVLEYVPDYLNFLQQCRLKAKYKIYHIPLDLSVSSIMWNSFVESRKNHGHLYYFTMESALASLKDTNHIIIDSFYTDVGTYYYKQSPAFKTAVSNLPRWILAFFNIALASKIFGRYSIMVLTK